MNRRGLLVLLSLCALEAQVIRPRIAVIAHRGEHLSHPENTIPAFQAAVEAGCDFFELDVRTTLDGKLVLMHDSDVSRMTSGHGEVARMTFDEIRKLQVGLKMGPRWAGTRVPSFDEALEFAKGTIRIYVDSKRISTADAVAAIERHSMGDNVVIYGGKAYLQEIARQRPHWKVMPEAESPRDLKTLLAALSLKVVAFDAKDFQDETIAIARAAGADIYVDRLGAADNEKFWQDAIDRGATGIQTDHPFELVAYLKSKGYR